MWDEAADRLVRIANAPLLLRAGRWLAGELIAHRRWLPGRAIERAARDLVVRPATCCAEGGSHHRLLSQLAEGSRFFEVVRRWLAAEGGHSEAAAARLDALLRVSLLGVLRQELLAREQARSGTPPALLIEAQIAPYPSCDQSCAGCYTEEERGGPEPDPALLPWLVDEAAGCGAFAIHIVGKGEPFQTRERAAGLVATVAARPHLLFVVGTNGRGIDTELADRLAALGNLLLLVSVDGDRVVHDARRGPGAHAGVQRAFAELRRAGALFGFSAMVSAGSLHAVSSPDLVREQARAGCVLGVYSPYFPLAARGWRELALDAAARRTWRVLLGEARAAAPIPLVDLDELEQQVGCRARAGISIYVDGVTGQVAPCLRVPFAPPDCRLDRARGIGLRHVLAHPFLAQYRSATTDASHVGCGQDLAAELTVVAGELARAGAGEVPRLEAYRHRCSVLAEQEDRRGTRGPRPAAPCTPTELR
jgi:hypothetical protein